MYSSHKIQLIVLFSAILFMYSLMAVQYRIWKYTSNKPIKASNKKTKTLLKTQSAMQGKDREIFKRSGKKVYMERNGEHFNQSGNNEHLKNSAEDMENGIRNSMFNILLWNNTANYNININEISYDNCEYSNCKLIVNKSHVKSSDAVIITSSHIIQNRSLPSFRTKHQRWILLDMDPTTQLFKNEALLKTYNGVFNVTASYKLSTADIYLPTGEIAHSSSPFSHLQSNYAKGKTKLAAAVLDECDDSSKKYTRELQTYIPIDVYGWCGNISCHQLNHHQRKNQQKESFDCLQTIATNYKFLLIIEGKAGHGHPSQLLWQTMQLDITPVIIGQANYTEILPSHSFIHMQDFESIQELADFLKVLDEHNKLYNGFFLWKKYYKISMWNSSKSSISFHCKLCKYMNTGNSFGKKKSL